MTFSELSELINHHYFMNFFTGKRLLYLTEAPEVTPPGLGECFVNPKYINALGLRDAVRRPPLYTNRRPPRPYNPYNNKNNNDKLVIQRRKRNSRKRRNVLKESTVRFWDFIFTFQLWYHLSQTFKQVGIVSKDKIPTISWIVIKIFFWNT